MNESNETVIWFIIGVSISLALWLENYVANVWIVRGSLILIMIGVWLMLFTMRGWV